MRMPYSRRRSTKGRGRRVSRKGVARVVKRVLSYNVERKYSNTTLYSGTASTTAWKFASAMPLGQGTTASQRIGVKIKVHKISFNIHIQPDHNNVELKGSVCRMVVYHNRRANGAVPAGGDVFVTDSIYAQRNQPKAKQFTLLRDYSHAMTITSAGAAAAKYAAGPAAFFNWTIYPRKMVQYQSNDATIADLLFDDWGFGFATDDTGCCEVTVTCQMIFSDM